MALLACVYAWMSSVSGDDKPDAAAPERPWLPDLAAGRAEATVQRRPILVRLGAAWCPWCRKLEAELARKETQKALEGLTLVSIDVDTEQPRRPGAWRRLDPRAAIDDASGQGRRVARWLRHRRGIDRMARRTGPKAA